MSFLAPSRIVIIINISCMLMICQALYTSYQNCHNKALHPYSTGTQFSTRIQCCVFSFFGTPLDRISKPSCLWEWVYDSSQPWSGNTSDVSHLWVEMNRVRVFSPHTFFPIHYLRQRWGPKKVAEPYNESNHYYLHFTAEETEAREIKQLTQSRQVAKSEFESVV